MVRNPSIVLLVIVACDAANAPRAYLRGDPPQAPARYYIEVGVPKPLAASLVIPSDIHATLYQKNERQIMGMIEASKGAPAGDRTRFRFDLPAGFMPETDATSLSVAVRDFAASDGSTDGWIIPVTSEIKTALNIDESCIPFGMGPYSVGYTLETDFTDDYGKQRLRAIIEQLKARPPAEIGRLRVEPRNKDRIDLRPIENFRFLEGGTAGQLCLKTAEGKPQVSKYDVQMAFASGAAFELASPLLLTDQPGESPLPALRAAQDKNDVGTRTFERNLDAAALLSSSINDTNKSGTSVRERRTQATLDVLFAPLLNWQATEVKRAGEPIWYWTPFFVDAKVSTGSITKDTLSLNRVVVGSEAEMRTYFNTRRFPTYLRHLIRLSNASDRDFKQAEGKLGYEFRPYLGLINRPLSSNIAIYRNQLDPDLKRGPKLIISTDRIGYEFVPIVGGEIGRTYTERRPAAPFSGVRFVRRLYIGGELTLNLTAYVKVSAKERLYIRGEAVNRDLYHNYFNGEAEFPIGGISAFAGQSLFFSFERGGQPPFATPDVNAVKLGYRVISNGWFGRLR